MKNTYEASTSTMYYHLKEKVFFILHICVRKIKSSTHKKHHLLAFDVKNIVLLLILYQLFQLKSILLQK